MRAVAIAMLLLLTACQSVTYIGCERGAVCTGDVSVAVSESPVDQDRGSNQISPNTEASLAGL